MTIYLYSKGTFSTILMIPHNCQYVNTFFDIFLKNFLKIKKGFSAFLFVVEFVGHIEPPITQAEIVIQAKVGDTDTGQGSEGGQGDDGGDGHDVYFLSYWDSFVPLQDYNITY